MLLVCCAIFHIVVKMSLLFLFSLVVSLRCVVWCASWYTVGRLHVLSHIRHRRRGAADSHACLQVVDEVCDGGNQDEEDEDDEEDDDVALHGCGCGWWNEGVSSVGVVEVEVVVVVVGVGTGDAMR